MCCVMWCDVMISATTEQVSLTKCFWTRRNKSQDKVSANGPLSALWRDVSLKGKEHLLSFFFFLKRINNFWKRWTPWGVFRVRVESLLLVRATRLLKFLIMTCNLNKPYTMCHYLIFDGLRMPRVVNATRLVSTRRQKQNLCMGREPSLHYP